MKTKILAVLLLSFVLTGVCLAKGPVTDDMIYNNVIIKLASDQVVKGGGLQVEVHQGVVTLRGTVEEQKQKDKAAKLAKKVAGVKSVDNEITVVERSGKK